ncbi:MULTISPECIES: cation diffusion facilitator family transporter [unclassified Chelatococcus]|uniref:cation diffusion facilitator family transporter n=1 Tax=unclassified Chelatococcus TaxID=2638111 RepID=UPI001BCCC091|nr:MULTISPECIES: cation diffusion facilitator family transporter [unclassified Chelatococcus]MBS7698488.1 cation diffusion facilitator family transporter [Chelatococcus sp. YT9]MBX3554861.1 cation diffusion facilitator family transporter [Chelatococcus sp.]
MNRATGTSLSAGNAAEINATERRKERVALVSIFVSALLTLAKGFAGFTTGSLALISDAANSLLDIAATTMTWLAIRAAHKPADDEHHYGHGKFESLSALIETAFLFLLSGAVAYEGIRRLMSGQTEILFSWIAVAVLVGSIVVDGWRWWTLRKVAAETNSEALAADALHFSSDLINSIFVLIAIAAAQLGFSQADPIIAIGVSVFIAIAAFRLARRTINTLLDTAPKGLGDSIAAEVEALPGVVGVDHVRVRPAGAHVIGEVGVRVSRTLPLESVQALKDRVREALDGEHPGSLFTVTTNPVQLDDETVMERVMLIAARLRVPLHHVTVQSLARRLSVSFDLEVDQRLTLGEAHKIASRVEIAIRDELGPDVEVESHIEPLVPQLDGREADAATVARVALALAEQATATEAIREVHSVRVRETPAGLVVNYHCRADGALNVAEVHEQVDVLERLVRADHPEICRVVGHAEPLATEPLRLSMGHPT